MIKEAGFTLFELVLTIVLCAILSTVIVAVISNPIKAYFLIADSAQGVSDGEFSLKHITKELEEALPTTIEIHHGAEKNTISFRKIIERRILLPSEKNSYDNNKTDQWVIKNLGNEKSPQVLFRLSKENLIEYNKKTQQLIKIEGDKDKTQSLLANHIQECLFLPLNGEIKKGVIVSIVVGKSKTKISMIQPIIYDKPYAHTL